LGVFCLEKSFDQSFASIVEAHSTLKDIPLAASLMFSFSLRHLRVIPLTLCFAFGLSLAVMAHNVEVAGDVAGTWHIEPDHAPKAGALAKVWIALTRQGGAILPFDQATCNLGVYETPRNPADQPILQPALQPISVEQYQGIPGAELVFPKTGLYQLELDCQPKTEGDFAAFQMQYDVTVATAASSPQPSASAAPETPAATSPGASPEAVNPAEPTTPQPSSLWVQIVGIGLGIVAALILLNLLRRLMGKK
jgi:hypothetical protein